MKLEQPSYDALIRAQWKYRAERLRHRRAGRHPIVSYQRYVATGYEYFWDQQIPEGGSRDVPTSEGALLC